MATSKERDQRQRPRRVLVVGGRGFGADVCVGWGDQRANVTDFDAVVVIPPEEDPEGDIQRRYSEEFGDLLLTGGSIYVVATPHTTWPRDDRIAFMPANNYDWCPTPLGITNRQGESIDTVDPSVAWLFDRVRTWSHTVAGPPPKPVAGYRGDQGIAVAYESNALATNRAGEALAMRVRFRLFEVQGDGFLDRRIGPTPIATSGWVYVLPCHGPWRAEEVAAEALSRYLDRLAGAPLPAWVTERLLPPTPDEDKELLELAQMQREIDARRPKALQEQAKKRRVAGLLYETGPALEALVAEAFVELGIALSEPIGNEEFLALHKGILAAVDVKGNSKSASGDDYRAALDHTLRLTTDGFDAHGILVVNAWRTDPPARRRNWFPDNIVRPATTQGTVALVRSVDVYQAVLRHRRAERVQDFLDAMFVASGLVVLETEG